MDGMLSVEELTAFASALLIAAGTSEANARVVASALVDADRQGAPSHGVMLLPMYLERVAAGSVDPRAAGSIVTDRGAAVVMDAANSFGQVTSERAADLCVARAKLHGLGSVAVRNGFHFGAAGRWTEAIARQGCFGLALCNTRPLMPAPGGANRVVGNNPIALSAPSGDGEVVTVDMALSAAAMGKIRLADASGETIPGDWAADADGVPTTDPAAAIRGMLLPAAGAKGFGLAMMADILAGGLSGGAIGAEVAGLYGDPAVPYRCAHFFLAIDVAAFRPLSEFSGAVAGFLASIRASVPAPGSSGVRVPGEASAQRRSTASTCRLPAATVEGLAQWAGRLGCALPASLTR